MKVQSQPVSLNPAQTESESRLVKAIALFAFRGVRTVIDTAKEVPGLVSQAATDVVEAWEESRGPKV
jgi:hypothetical protein